MNELQSHHVLVSLLFFSIVIFFPHLHILIRHTLRYHRNCHSGSVLVYIYYRVVNRIHKGELLFSEASTHVVCWFLCYLHFFCMCV